VVYDVGAKSDDSTPPTENNQNSPTNCPVSDNNLILPPDCPTTPPPTDNLILRFTWGREGIIDLP